LIDDQKLGERATLLIEFWTSYDEDSDALSASLKGRDNGPVHIGVIEAAVALIRIVALTPSRVEI